MKYLAIMVGLALCLSACSGPRVASNTENLNVVVVPFNSKDMAQAIEAVKENMVFFKVKSKCFGCVFVHPNERAIPILVEVSCDGLE
jgi:hypothetical protein